MLHVLEEDLDADARADKERGDGKRDQRTVVGVADVFIEVLARGGEGPSRSQCALMSV